MALVQNFICPDGRPTGSHSEMGLEGDHGDLPQAKTFGPQIYNLPI